MSLEDQVAAINPGDWVRAKFSSDDGQPDWIVESEVTAPWPDRALSLGQDYLRAPSGEPAEYLREILVHRRKPAPDLVESEGTFWQRRGSTGWYDPLPRYSNLMPKAFSDLVEPREAELRVKP